jgi:hypothetical protein
MMIRDTSIHFSSLSTFFQLGYKLQRLLIFLLHSCLFVTFCGCGSNHDITIDILDDSDSHDFADRASNFIHDLKLENDGDLIGDYLYGIDTSKYQGRPPLKGEIYICWHNKFEDYTFKGRPFENNFVRDIRTNFTFENGQWKPTNIYSLVQVSSRKKNVYGTPEAKFKRLKVPEAVIAGIAEAFDLSNQEVASAINNKMLGVIVNSDRPIPLHSLARKSLPAVDYSGGENGSENQGFFGWIFGWIWTIVKYTIGALVVYMVCFSLLCIFPSFREKYVDDAKSLQVKYTEMIETLNEMLKEGTIDVEFYTRAMEEIDDKIKHHNVVIPSHVQRTTTAKQLPKATSSVQINKTIHYACPMCQHVMEFPVKTIKSLLGKNGKCPSCKNIFILDETDFRLPLD